MTDLDALCGRLFDAFVAHDLDAVDAMLADGAVITQNGTAMSWAQARPVLAGLIDVIRDLRYTDVRRTVGDRTVVEEHTVVGELPDGRPVHLAACVVVRVDDAGAITSLDEYVDTAGLA